VNMKTTENKTLLETIITKLPTTLADHPTSKPQYLMVKELVQNEIKRLFSQNSSGRIDFSPFGELVFPYFEMGAINSLDLFGLDELIIFSFYWANRAQYKKVLDIGGNIGLHSIIMDKCGYVVDAYEPDPVHFEKLEENLQVNNCKNVTTHQAAISTQEGQAEFVRVLGNTTSSHLKGSKNPYGELETFTVDLFDLRKLMKSADFMKMDVEGHEKALILGTSYEDWENIDAMIEIGTEENAIAIFNHLEKINVNAFSQKKGWDKVLELSEVPTSHRDGSIFITTKECMPWGSSNETETKADSELVFNK